MVKVLSIDTARESCGVGLFDSASAQFNSIVKTLPQQQSAHVLGFIQEILLQNKTDLTAVDVISYNRGPGSYTGTRLACCVAIALAHLKNIPVLGFSQTMLMAQSLYQLHGYSNLCALYRTSAKSPPFVGVYGEVTGKKVIQNIQEGWGIEILRLRQELAPNWYCFGNATDNLNSNLTSNLIIVSQVLDAEANLLLQSLTSLSLHFLEIGKKNAEIFPIYQPNDF